LSGGISTAFWKEDDDRIWLAPRALLDVAGGNARDSVVKFLGRAEQASSMLGFDDTMLVDGRQALPRQPSDAGQS